MVMPILLYLSDFWGSLKLPKNNPIEKTHNMFCRQLLGVQKQTSTQGVLLELGLTPLVPFAKKVSVKNWNRICNNNANEIVIESQENSCKENLPWTSSVKGILESNGLLQLYLDNQVTDKETRNTIPVENYLYSRLIDQYHQSAFEEIRNPNSKMFTYSKFKTTIGREKYLSTVKKEKHRIAMTKIRLSNHKLAIETGRHNKIDRENRICPLCTNGVENEEHFMMKCPAYSELRTRYLPPPNAWLPDDIKLQQIFIRDDVDQTKIARFIHEALSIRDQKQKSASLRMILRKNTIPLEQDRNLVVSRISIDDMKLKITRAYNSTYTVIKK